MPSGTTLLLNGAYDEAIRRLRMESNRDSQDDLRTGKTYDLGVALLLSGDFDAAEIHFRRLRDEAWKSVSGHLIYIGATHWYQKRYADAVREWIQASKCAYQGNTGLDSAVILYFAAVSNSAAYSADEALDRISHVLRRLNLAYYPSAIAQFLLRQIGREDFIEAMSRSEGRFSKHWRTVQLSIAHFYLAIDSLRSGDANAFASSLQNCAESTRTQSVYDEIVFSRLECSHRGIPFTLPGAASPL